MVWSYHVDDWVQSSPAFAGGNVYFGSHDHNVYCLDASDGTFVWSHMTGDTVSSSPAIHDGKVYIGSFDGNVYCLDGTNGDVVWTYPTGDSVYASPAVFDGRIYVGSFDNNVYCLAAADGSLVWSQGIGGWVLSPAIADGKLYTATYGGAVHCLNAESGLPLWSYATGDEIWYPPSIADGKVYVGSLDHHLYCFGQDLPAHVLLRRGNVNAGTGALADVLYVNGSVGDAERELTVSVGTPLSCAMELPPEGPDPARFALYAWRGEPGAGNLSLQPRDLGSMVFGTYLSSSDGTLPFKVWNNIGKTNRLGDPNYPSDPAPSTVFDKASGSNNPITVTFQGFILDNGSSADVDASITNAVILKVVE
jgi:hypothetical protein